MVLSRSHVVAVFVLLTKISSILATPSFVIEEGRPANTLIVDLSTSKLSDFSSSPTSLNCSVQTCSYALSSQSPDVSKYFDLGLQSGRITTKQVFDRESFLPTLNNIVEFPINFIATNTQGGLAFGSLVVVIGDVNDNAPAFADAVESLTISEAFFEKANSKLFIAAAMDLDAGENGTLTYAIESGNVNDTFTLGVDTSTGIPYLTTTRSLDRETTPHYCLNVSAHDNPTNAALRRSGSHIVDIRLLDTNDNGPRFDNKTYSFRLNENAPSGIRVGQVLASDPDAGPNGHVTYRLTNSYGRPETHFVIDNQTGLIRTTSDAFDYEAEASSKYEFFVKAQDNPSDSRESTFETDVIVSVFIQDVNDEAPRIDLNPVIQNSNATHGYLPEGYVKGLVIVQLSLTDPDTGDARGSHVDSHMTGGDGYFAYLPPPRIDEFGEIIINKTLDHESQNAFTLTIVAADRGDPPLSSSAVFNVIIQDRNDVVPRFDHVTYSASVAESEGAGVSVVKVTALDVDKDSRLRYSINSVHPSSFAKAFAINESSGLLTTLMSLDRELASMVRVEVRVSDGLHVAYANVSITVLDVNDHVPVFEKNLYVFEVPEAQANAVVGQVKATDADDGVFSDIEYFLRENAADVASFSVTRASGVIRTKFTLDYEGDRQYNITIIAQNKGDATMKSEVRVTVNVQDVNDNRPSFHYNAAGMFFFQVDKLTELNKVVFTVSADDPDTGAGGVVSYHLISANNDAASTRWLSIKSDTGAIAVVHNLNHFKTGNYSFVVRAEDGSGKLANADLVVEISQTGVDPGGDPVGDSPPENAFGNTLIILIVALVVLVVVLFLAVLLFLFRQRARDWILQKDVERGGGGGGGANNENGGVELKGARRKSSSRVQFAIDDLVTVNEYVKDSVKESDEPMTPRYDPDGEDKAEKEAEGTRKPVVAATIVPRYSARSRKPIQNEESAVLDKDAEVGSDSDSTADSGLATCDSVTTPSVSSTRGLLPSNSGSRHDANGQLATPL